MSSVELSFRMPEVRFKKKTFKHVQAHKQSRDSAVGIVTGYRLDDRRLGVRISVGSRISLFHVVQTGSGVHPTSYPMGTVGSFSGGKAAGA
jgi:hypothetical protein